MSDYFNPYSDTTFFSFLWTLIQRFMAFVSGDVSLQSAAADEIQIAVLAGLSISSALVGTFLVLRRLTMLANALSHTVLFGIVCAYLFMMHLIHSQDPYRILSIPVLMIAAFGTGLLTTFLTEFLTRVMKVQEDASIGLVFSILFALGIVLVTLFSRNVHIGTELVMGNVDALQKEDVKGILTILGVNAALFALLFNGFKITAFDPQLAKTLGFSPFFFNYLLMVQTSLTAIGAFRAVGVLMVLAFLVIPVLTARLLTHSLSLLIVLASAIGCLASILGVALSRHLLTVFGIGLSTGGIVVTVMGILYLAACIFAPQKGLLAAWLYKSQIRRSVVEE